MIDADRLRALLAVGEEHVAALADVLPEDVDEYIRDRNTRLMTERALQVAIESVMGAANVLARGLKLGLAGDEDGVIERLVGPGRLSPEDAVILRDLRRFRNVLVHRYAALDHAVVHEHALAAQVDIPRLMRVLVAAADGR